MRRKERERQNEKSVVSICFVVPVVVGSGQYRSPYINCSKTSICSAEGRAGLSKCIGWGHSCPAAQSCFLFYVPLPLMVLGDGH